MGCKHKWRCSRLLTDRTGFDSLATHHIWSLKLLGIVVAWKAIWPRKGLCFEYTGLRQL